MVPGRLHSPILARLAKCWRVRLLPVRHEALANVTRGSASAGVERLHRVQAQRGQRNKTHALATSLSGSSNARMVLLHVRCEVMIYGLKPSQVRDCNCKTLVEVAVVASLRVSVVVPLPSAVVPPALPFQLVPPVLRIIAFWVPPLRVAGPTKFFPSSDRCSLRRLGGEANQRFRQSLAIRPAGDIYTISI